MPFAMRRSGRAALAILIAACVSSLPQLSAQQTEPAVPTQYLTLDHTPSSRLNAADLNLLRARRAGISAEAAFFGYNLHAG